MSTNKVPPITQHSPDEDTGTGVDSPIDYVSGAPHQNNAGEGYAAQNNYSGDTFRASAGIGNNPDTDIRDTRDTNAGTTSIGAVDLNADTPALGGYSTSSAAGVRNAPDGPGAEAGGVTAAGSDPLRPSEEAPDALTGDHVDEKRSGVVLNEPANNTPVSAAHNAGSSTEGAVHGVIGDVTNPNNRTSSNST